MGFKNATIVNGKVQLETRQLTKAQFLKRKQRVQDHLAAINKEIQSLKNQSDDLKDQKLIIQERLQDIQALENQLP